MRHARRLIVNPIVCEAHGICAELVPEMIQLDDWGYPMVSPEAIPRELEAHVRRAVSACPTLALRIIKIETQRTASRQDVDRNSLGGSALT